MNDILIAKNISKTFTNIKIPALSCISFTLRKGECLGIIGNSGSGKSTLAKILLGLEPADTGEIFFKNTLIDFKNVTERTRYYQKVQLIFQNPLASFHPRKTLLQSMILPLLNLGTPKKLAQKKIEELMIAVSLPLDYLRKLPNQISGGECQRAAIARALSISPQVLICDEITSSLDLCVQAEIINLLKSLQEKNKLSLIFISHDIVLAQNICSALIVIDNGKIVEQNQTNTIFTQPQHPYTIELITAAKNSLANYNK